MDRTELRGRWVEALRSGRYEQHRGGLRSRWGAYCCLGVAAEVAGEEFWRDPSTGLCYLDGDDGPWYGLLPRRVVDALGLRGPAGELAAPVEVRGVERGDLASMNDSGSTFREIADFVEGNPGLVFAGETGRGQ